MESTLLKGFHAVSFTLRPREITAVWKVLRLYVNKRVICESKSIGWRAGGQWECSPETGGWQTPLLCSPPNLPAQTVTWDMGVPRCRSWRAPVAEHQSHPIPWRGCWVWRVTALSTSPVTVCEAGGCHTSLTAGWSSCGGVPLLA